MIHIINAAQVAAFFFCIKTVYTFEGFHPFLARKTSSKHGLSSVKMR